MPPPLPERFRLEVRLGRDEDIEEWLGTDSELDRPVLIRFLGADASEHRRAQFLAATRAASRVHHAHLAAIFDAGEIPDGVFAVSDWAGGMSLRDRIASGDRIDVDEFLPNAAGLAAALADLHDEGTLHGGIDTGAIFYSVAHPAKLGAFGRDRRGWSTSDDVAALATALETALTGRPPGGPPPSEVVDRLPPRVDRALRAGQGGQMSARTFAEELKAAPSPFRLPEEPEGWSRRLVLSAAGLMAAAVGLVALGTFVLAAPGGPVLFPTTSAVGEQIDVPSTSTTVIVIDPENPILAITPIEEIRVLDPFGEGGENDELLTNMIDGDPATSWRTETYQDPIGLLKPGVGVMVRVDSQPELLTLTGLSGATAFEIGWTASPPDGDDWERVLAARSPGRTVTYQLPTRDGGWWVVWMTDLPSVDGGFRAEIGELRFQG